MKHFSVFFIFGLVSLVLVGCGSTNTFFRHETAQRLAAPAWMVERQIPAGPFSLTAYERIRERGATANIYIEGDGQAWMSKTMKSMDPTPKNPVALHLATRDSSDNLIYLARPCQYTKTISGDRCDDAYWGKKRFAPEVLSAYVAALDNIKKHYNISGFNLVGYSGGGALVALLAAERDDVLSLRTVAGNLDHKAHSALHNVSMLDESLNPPTYAKHLRDVPQVHFVGENDEIVPVSISQSYMAALGDDRCARVEIVSGATHDSKWVERWPELLKIKPACAFVLEADAPAFVPLDEDWMVPEPIRTERFKPSKP